MYMKRSDFKKIIRLRSRLNIRKNAKNGTQELQEHLNELIVQQMDLDNLYIDESGNLNHGYKSMENGKIKKYVIMKPFEDNEEVSFGDMLDRIYDLSQEIIENR